MQLAVLELSSAVLKNDQNMSVERLRGTRMGYHHKYWQDEWVTRSCVLEALMSLAVSIKVLVRATVLLDQSSFSFTHALLLSNSEVLPVQKLWDLGC